MKATLQKKEFHVSDLSWNNERSVFQMFVKRDASEQQNGYHVDREIRVGRGLIYSKDYQKCYVLGAKKSRR